MLPIYAVGLEFFRPHYHPMSYCWAHCVQHYCVGSSCSGVHTFLPNSPGTTTQAPILLHLPRFWPGRISWFDWTLLAATPHILSLRFLQAWIRFYIVWTKFIYFRVPPQKTWSTADVHVLSLPTSWVVGLGLCTPKRRVLLPFHHQNFAPLLVAFPPIFRASIQILGSGTGCFCPLGSGSALSGGLNLWLSSAFSRASGTDFSPCLLSSQSHFLYKLCSLLSSFYTDFQGFL